MLELIGKVLRPVDTVHVDCWLRRSMLLLGQLLMLMLLLLLEHHRAAHRVDVGGRPRGDQAVDRWDSELRDLVTRIGHVNLVLSIVVTAHGSKVSKYFLLDGTYFFHLVVPDIGRSVSRSESAGLSPLVRFFKQLVALGAELFEQVDGKQTLFTLVHHMRDRSIDNSRFGRSSVVRQRR